MSYTIEAIEDAIIAAVDAITAVTIKTVKSYNGDLDQADLRRLTGPLPAVYVIYGGSKYVDHGARKVEAMRYRLLVCDKNLRAEAEARRGGTGNPGTYAMLNAIRDALCGEQLSMTITPLALLREDPIFNGSGISVYGAEYGTSQSHLYT